MATRARLDAELVRRGLVRSRTEAQDLIAAGAVTVDGWRASKASTAVAPATAIVVSADIGPRWVSRGAHKLIGALNRFDQVSVADRRCLDAGASTGGFTEVLLQRGAASVMAVDVGYGQLAWSLRDDPRVTPMDRCNVRELTLAAIGEPADLIVGDLSFISLRTVLPALVALTASAGDLVLMCKPQFEVGKDLVGTGGVVREPELRISAIMGVAAAAAALELDTLDVVASPLPGPSGNVEYFLWLRRRNATVPLKPVAELAANAVAEGPQ